MLMMLSGLHGIVVIALCSVLSRAASETFIYSGTGSVNGSEGLGSNKPVILLGGLFPVHRNEENECGGVLDLGIQRLEAMVFATRTINEDPSLLPGVTLAFEIRDTCVQANQALEQSLDYVSARDTSNSHLHPNGTVLGISGVVGAASSGVSISVANLLRLFQIPQISYASTAKILSDKTRFDYFLRTVPPDSFQARAMADIVEYFNWTYVYALHSDDAYGSEGIQAFVFELKKRNRTNMCVAITIQIPIVTTDAVYDRVIQKMSQEWVRNATVAVLFGQLATARGVLNAVRRREQVLPGFAQNFTWIGSDAWGDQLPAELHPIAKGMLSVIPKAKLSDEFDRYFESLNPLSNSANPWFNEYWESVFNCSFVNEEGFRDCDPMNEVIAPGAGYRQNSKVTFTVDAVYAFAHGIHAMISELCPDGILCPEILNQRSGGVAIRGDILLKYLHNISFAGASADVIAFDNSGDEEGGFLIKNLQRLTNLDSYIFETVGLWDVHSTSNSFLEIYGAIRWNQGEEAPQSVCSLPCGGGEEPERVPNQAECCWTCKVCLGDRLISSGLVCTECDVGFIPNGNRTECVLIPPTYLMWSSPWSIIILITTCFGIIATFFVIIIFILFYKNSLIKASSRELSAILIIGIMLCYLLPFFFLAKPSAAICAIRRFGVGFCFCVCYSALLVKTNRIHRIFNRSKTSIQKPPLISPQSQILFTFILVSVQVVIATVWLVVEKPGVKKFYDDFSTELKCNESPHVGLSVSLGYNLILLLLSTFFAFRARKIPQNFNEAKFINLTLYTICIIWLAFIPTYFATAKLGTVYQTSSQVIAIALSATTTLCCLFMPKIYFLISQMRKEYTNSSSQGSQHQRDRHNSITSANGTATLFPNNDRRRSSLYAFDLASITSSAHRQRSESASSYKTSLTSIPHYSVNSISEMPSTNYRRSTPSVSDGTYHHLELSVVAEEEETVDSSAPPSKVNLDTEKLSAVGEEDEVFSSKHVEADCEIGSKYSDVSTQTQEYVECPTIALTSPMIHKDTLYQFIPLPPSSTATPSSSTFDLNDC